MSDRARYFTDYHFVPQLQEKFLFLSGAGNFNKYLRQAIFLHVMETTGEGNFARSCSLLNFNQHTAKMWYNSTSPVYTPEFVKAKYAIRERWDQSKIKDNPSYDWREEPVYKDAIQKLMTEHSLGNAIVHPEKREPHVVVSSRFLEELLNGLLGKDPTNAGTKESGDGGHER